MSSIDRRNAEYGPLIQDFKNEVKELNINGITGPHFPGIGECYDLAKYKFAFCGMETYGWNKMEDFMLRKENDYLSDSDTRLNDLEHLGWAANFHDTFWGFVFHFLAEFYKVYFKNLLLAKEWDATSRSILKSFVWANANCIERYEVTSQGQGAEIETWNAVKNARRRFDDLNHIINSCTPKVIFIIYGGANEEYILNDSTLSDIFGINFEQRKNVLK